MLYYGYGINRNTRRSTQSILAQHFPAQRVAHVEWGSHYGSIGQSSARWPATWVMPAQSVQRLADVLAKEGLVVYKDNPADQRTRLLELTPQGAEILAEIYAQQEKWSRHMMTKLDATQLAEISDALEKVAQILETDE